MFYNGGVTYFLRDHCKRFFENIKDDNKLSKAVYHDLQIPSFLSGCRALGLINKFVTGPLWRLFESGIHILDMNKHYQKMCDLFLELSVDSSKFISGDISFFDNVDIHKDATFYSLIEPSEFFDPSTKAMNYCLVPYPLSHVESSQIQSLPDISSPFDLIGKRVEHFTFDSSGKQKSYDGWVV